MSRQEVTFLTKKANGCRMGTIKGLKLISQEVLFFLPTNSKFTPSVLINLLKEYLRYDNMCITIQKQTVELIIFLNKRRSYHVLS